MNVLELFAGTASFGNVAIRGGHNVFTSDYDPQFKTDYCVDIMEFDVNKIPFNVDIVWASPPCETFSVASIGHHWINGGLRPTARTQAAQIGIDRVKKTISIINELKPKYWYIENPRGMLRKIIPELLDEQLGNFWIRRTVTYCQYGDSRMKPTDIWTNDFNWKPKPMCKNGSPCHISAPRGSRTGTQGIGTYIDRSRIPDELCESILNNMEQTT